MKNLKLSNLKKQSGVILVLALVILLVLTMLIVSSMNTTNTQVLMTGNTQFQTQALNDAETALRFAENSIQLFATDPNAKPGGGYRNISTGQNAEDFSVFKWDDLTTMGSYTNANTSRTSFYVIEYTGLIPLTGASLAVTQNNTVIGDEAYLFRVTARGKSARGAARMVQSVYVTTAPPL
ncbi:hypothetical protein MNBD_GAMMA22-2638 [hydrothermal vent metagenome]|uniref:Type 4 fimbrial biogenesis protein PilX N-terminal domain-containing protein n=1 Tax=hydrothermal vent metagenome TaxID=652676 RepID=A0A3B0ZCK2_9ZZZZ